jgi:hypothetical protein
VGISFYWRQKSQVSLGTNLSMDYVSFERDYNNEKYKLILLFEPRQSFFVVYSYFLAEQDVGISFESHWYKSYYPEPKGAEGLLESSKVSINKHSLSFSFVFALR